jgi:lipid-A-disaccharide synthase
MTRVFISCGEASGDLYAAALAEALRRRDPGVEIVGFGGPRLAGAGARLVEDYRHYSVTGLAEVLKQLPRTWRLYRRLVAEARATPPDVFVAIDFPDFNFRLASAMHRLGVPVVYYVVPQLWAWREGRLEAMRRFASLVLPIFPFEPRLYQDAGIPVEFVGHPLVDLIPPTPLREIVLREAGLDPDRPVLAVLPGSRPNEVHKILPDLVTTLPLLAERVVGIQALVARAPNLDDALFAPLAAARADGRVPLAVIEGRADDVLAASDVVLTASGTATVQTALHEKPMVIVYRVSELSYFLGRRFLKVDTFGMANLIAGKKVATELIQDFFSPERVAAEVARLFSEPDVAEAMRAEWREVKRRLGGGGASDRAADAILRVATDRASVADVAPPSAAGGR